MSARQGMAVSHYLSRFSGAYRGRLERAAESVYDYMRGALIGIRDDEMLQVEAGITEIARGWRVHAEDLRTYLAAVGVDALAAEETGH